MRIIRVSVDHFGTLSNYQKELEPNIDCVYEENGAGKTTLAAFISAMLYGLDSAKRTKALRDRERYAPWGGGGYGGALEVEKDGAAYRIERSFGYTSSTGDTLTVYDLTTGARTEALGVCPGETLLGFGKEAFYRTSFLSSSDPGAPTDLLPKINKSINGTDESGTYDRAIARLDAARKELKADRGAKGKIDTLEKSLSDAERNEKLCKASLDAADDLSKSIYQKRENLSAMRDRISLGRKLETQKLIIDTSADNAAKTNEAKKALEDFYAAHGTVRASAEELSALENDLTALREYKKKRGEEPFDGEDSEQYARLCAVFEDHPFTAEELKTLSEDVAELKKNKKILEDEPQERVNHELEDLERRFHGSVPTDEEIEQLSYLCADYENAETEYLKRLEEQRAKHAMPAPGIPAIIAAVCFLISLIAAAVLAFSSLPSAYMFVISAAFLFAAILLYVLIDVKKAKNKAAGEKEKDKRYEALKRSLGEKLGIYQYDTSNLPLALSKLITDRKTYTSAKSAEQTKKQKSLAAQSRIALLSPRVRAVFDRYPYLGVYEDDETKLSVLSGDALKYETYTGVAEKHRKDLESARGAALSAKEEISAILEKCGYVPGSYFEEEAVRKEKQLTAELKDLNRIYDQRREDQEKYDREHVPDEELSKLIGENIDADALEAQASGLATLIAAEEKRYEDANRIAEQLDETSSSAAKLRIDVKEAKERLKILSKTKELLEKSESRLLDKYTEPIKNAYTKYANEIGKELTDGVRINQKDLSLSFERSGKLKRNENFSSGFTALTDVCLRLALLETVYERDLPFLILDDPFVYLDDGNTKKALEMLRKLSTRTQILYLTCHSSRKV